MNSCASGSQSSRRADLRRVALIPSGPGELVFNSFENVGISKPKTKKKLDNAFRWRLIEIYLF
jgi:hypothetical protein